MAFNMPMATAESAHPSQPWDAAAAGWDHHSALIHAWLQDITQNMLSDANIKPGSRVLDVAAGAGDQTLDIARRVGPTGCVLATDMSASILARAQKNADAAGLVQVNTQVANAEALGMKGSNFDAAVCRLGLMFCHAPLAALHEIRAALKPQGRLSALVFGRPEHNPCLAITLRTARQHACETNGAQVAVNQSDLPGSLMSLGKSGLLEDLLLRAGFVNVSARYVPAPFRTASAEQYVAFLRASASPVMEILAPLTPAQKQAAWRDITEQLKVFSTPQGWAGPNDLLQCVATSPS